MDLMFEVQKHGQPPQEIIGDIAPGLFFDNDGLPAFKESSQTFDPNDLGEFDIEEISKQMTNGECLIM